MGNSDQTIAKPGQYFAVMILSNMYDDKILADNDVLERVVMMTNQLLSEDQEEAILLDYLEEVYAGMHIERIPSNATVAELPNDIDPKWNLVWNNLDEKGRDKVRLSYYRESLGHNGGSIVVQQSAVGYLGSSDIDSYIATQKQQRQEEYKVIR